MATKVSSYLAGCKAWANTGIGLLSCSMSVNVADDIFERLYRYSPKFCKVCCDPVIDVYVGDCRLPVARASKLPVGE